MSDSRPNSLAQVTVDPTRKQERVVAVKLNELIGVGRGRSQNIEIAKEWLLSDSLDDKNFLGPGELEAHTASSRVGHESHRHANWWSRTGHDTTLFSVVTRTFFLAPAPAFGLDMAFMSFFASFFGAIV